MHRNRCTLWLARGAFALGLLGGIGSAHALGVGKMTMMSGLDEPLSAEIELSAATPSELKNLAASLAPRSEFDNAGIDRPVHLNQIKYAVVTRADGRAVLRLSTDQPMREPFLHFLLQVDWTGGRLIREYTALLDPPHLVAARPAPVQTPIAETPPELPPSFKEEPVAPPPAAQSTPTNEQPKPEVMVPSPAAPIAQTGTADDLMGPGGATDTMSAPSGSHAGTAQGPAIIAQTDAAPKTVAPAPTVTDAPRVYGPIKKGETLSQITAQLQLTRDLHAQQVMLALLKTNKAAFFGNNVNNLKAGKVLTIPDRATVEAMPAPVALKEFKAQYNSWQEYKLKLANAAQVVTVPAQDSSAKGEIAPNKTAPTKPDAKTAKDTTSTELLKIVRADEKKGAQGAGTDAAKAGAERRALLDRATTLEESLASKDLENKELRARVSQLESQVKNSKRLMELENKELAKAQKQASDSAKAKETKPEVAPAPPPTAAQENAPKEKVPAVGATPEKPAVPGADTGVQPKAPPKVSSPPAAPPEEEGFVASLLKDVDANGLMLPVGGAVLVLAALALLIYFRRRRQAIAEFGESILSGGLNMNSEGTGTGAPADAAGGEVSFLSDFSQGGMGNIHTDEVDPIAEAEVYLAYGRDEQAEEILKEAVIKDPGRHELRLKLLEIYHQRNDVAAFETVAEELYAALEGKGGKVWEKVEEMGYKMNPENPMFRGGAARASNVMPATAVAAVSGTAADDELTLDMPTKNFDEREPKPAVGTGDVPSDGDFSFDLDFNENKSDAPDYGQNDTAAPDAGSSIDFDFASLTMEVEGGSPKDGLADPNDGLQFDPANPAADALSDLALDADTGTGAGGLEFSAPANNDDGDQIDETATKLDLAKAYIDMGDADGARSILDEVLAEGNDSQKQQAARLAAQIAA